MSEMFVFIESESEKWEDLRSSLNKAIQEKVIRNKYKKKNYVVTVAEVTKKEAEELNMIKNN